MKRKEWTVATGQLVFSVYAIDEANARREARAYLVNNLTNIFAGIKRLPRGTVVKVRSRQHDQ